MDEEFKSELQQIAKEAVCDHEDKVLHLELRDPIVTGKGAVHGIEECKNCGALLVKLRERTKFKTSEEEPSHRNNGKNLKA